MSPAVFARIGELRRALAVARREGKVIGLVPTMGALHTGHGRLMERARRECGCVVVSIFVNPTQFNDPQDFSKYPRTLEQDLKFCRARAADLVFAPEAAEMYPQPGKTAVEVRGVSEGLCGEFRPGHFRGVATVVAKLFNIVQPDHAYFGQKDAQQLAVIRRMVRDLDFPVVIVGVPTVREADGLALSSRNQRLSPEQRSFAPALYRALLGMQALIAGGAEDPGIVRRQALDELARVPPMRVEYLEIVDPEEMRPVERIQGPVLAAVAVYLGATRLIDNQLCAPPPALCSACKAGRCPAHPWPA